MDESRSSRSIISWRGHVMVLAVMAIVYGALLYFGVVYMRAPVSATAKGPPMFMPIATEVGEQREGMTEAKPSAEQEPLQAQEQSPPPRHWRFPEIDLMPSAPGWTATASDLTPVTNAEPDPSEVKAPAPEEQPAEESDLARPKLQMVGWFRPVYERNQCARLHADHLLVLDLLIDPAGQPAGITLAQSSGSPHLDKTALDAAGFWRFAPPLWNAQPIEVSAKVMLRFNC
jgi:TonB family protein